MTLIAWVLFVCWVLLLAQLLLNLALLPRLDASAQPAAYPFVSIIVPARDEATTIEPAVRSLLAQNYPHFEVIVVDDRSSDGTGSILARMASADSRLVVLRGRELPEQWLGKPWALHQGGEIARGEFLLFVDADVHYEPAALRALVASFLEHRSGALSVFPRLVMHGFWENLLMPFLPLAVLVELPTWLANRSTFPRLAVGGGPGNLLRRETYLAIGGHAALSNAVIDDVGLVRLVRRNGSRTVLIRGCNLVSLRMYRGLSEIIEGFTKNSSLVFGNNLPLIMVLILFGVAVHVVPYGLGLIALWQWISGTPWSAAAVLGAAAVGLITIVRVILFRSLRYRIDNAILGHPLMLLLMQYIVIRSAWKLAVKRQLTWRGRTYSADWIRFGGDRLP